MNATIQTPTQTDQLAVRMLVRAREDFQAMRKRMDNRIGRKASYRVSIDEETGDVIAKGEEQQNIDERVLRPDDMAYFAGIANAAKYQEAMIEKKLKETLKRFPVYTEFLSGVKGVGDIAAGWIIGEYDIHKATTVSKLWQFTGLNPGMVPGKKRIENKDGTFSYVPSGDLVRGDRLTPGHVAPFNKRLRTAMVGVLADGFIKAQSPYALEYYYPYKERLANEQNIPTTADPEKGKPWKDDSKGHRDRAAKRYMIKMFLKDLYVAWRTLEGLPVRKSYQEEYLGHAHGEEV